MEALQKSQCPKFLRGKQCLLFFLLLSLINDHPQRNNKLVWNETVRIVEEMFEDGWNIQETGEIDDILEVTASVSLLNLSLTSLELILTYSQISLFVISAASFGRSLSWKKTDECPPGFTMTFRVCSTSFVIYLARALTRSPGRLTLDVTSWRSPQGHNSRLAPEAWSDKDVERRQHLIYRAQSRYHQLGIGSTLICRSFRGICWI